MKIGVLNIYSFPYGLAPTNRILAYCKGLVENGVECEIISVRPQVRKHEGLKKEAFINGASYFHFIQIPPVKNRILKSILFRFSNLICLWKSIWHIYKSNESEHYDAVILSFDQPAILLPVVLILHILKINMYAIADEYPTPIRRKLKNDIPKYKKKFYRYISKFLKGRILMTNNLARFYNQIYPLPYIILSTITDTTRFKYRADIDPELEKPYICYMGNMELSKDNVDNIIQAFSKVHDYYPSLKLYLFGNPSNNDRETLITLINNLNLNNSVRIMGLVRYNDVPTILQHAKILVTSQPNTKRAAGGFPTKMGEYMMSGRPCILTDVGEIRRYVKNKENAYVVAANSPNEYADTIIYIIQNYQEALAVARSAKKYIIENFSSSSAGKQIVAFIMKEQNTIHV